MPSHTLRTLRDIRCGAAEAKRLGVKAGPASLVRKGAISLSDVSFKIASRVVYSIRWALMLIVIYPFRGFDLVQRPR